MSGPAAVRAEPFSVRLDNFTGPFDLLLQLIGRHQLDVTEVALSQVTDEFLAHISAAGEQWDLEQTSAFVVVAATLLDLKAARLIPAGEVEDVEDLAALEAGDLLFARLLQYRAYKQVASYLGQRLAEQERRMPARVGVEPRLIPRLPEVVIGIGPDRLAALAAAALAPRPPERVDLTHLHAPVVSVREQAAVLVDRLRRTGTRTFRSLTADVDRLTVVARFLALLELFREGVIAFEQLAPLSELTVRWTGSDQAVAVGEEFDVLDRPEVSR